MKCHSVTHIARGQLRQLAAAGTININYKLSTVLTKSTVSGWLQEHDLLKLTRDGFVSDSHISLHVSSLQLHLGQEFAFC